MQGVFITTVLRNESDKPQKTNTKDDLMRFESTGTVQGIRTLEAAGYSLQVIEVTFEENRMKLSVPVNKASSSGLRKLCTT